MWKMVTLHSQVQQQHADGVLVSMLLSGRAIQARHCWQDRKLWWRPSAFVWSSRCCLNQKEPLLTTRTEKRVATLYSVFLVPFFTRPVTPQTANPTFMQKPQSKCDSRSGRRAYRTAKSALNSNLHLGEDPTTLYARTLAISI